MHQTALCFQKPPKLLNYALISDDRKVRIIVNRQNVSWISNAEKSAQERTRNAQKMRVIASSARKCPGSPSMESVLKNAPGMHRKCGET
jgi:hypothetical protein